MTASSSQVQQPVIIHWLGEMFDPALEGYWGNHDHMAAMETASPSSTPTPTRSMASRSRCWTRRRRSPCAAACRAGVRMYTGDDFNYAELIAGDEHGHSDALLGIFDAIAPAVGGALAALSRNDLTTFHDILAPTVPLSRHIFKAPTRFYKTGVVFLAWLNGHQDHFVMVGGQQSHAQLQHFSELFRLADKAGLLRDPDLAVARMRSLLALHGVA